MCNLYGSVDADTLRTQLFKGLDGLTWDHTVAPLGQGVFVKQDSVAQVGQWGMIPPSSKERTPKTREGRRMSTNNARRETVATAWTYRFPWARQQRCLIPAAWFQEPYWGITHADPMTLSKNTWWRFWRDDGEPWMLAGLWSEWTDPATGEVVPNYTMLTQNCDGHPLLALMHSMGRLFPSSDRSPSLSPVAHSALLNKLDTHPELTQWQGGRMQRVASGFYTSQAWEWTRA